VKSKVVYNQTELFAGCAGCSFSNTLRLEPAPALGCTSVQGVAVVALIFFKKKKYK